MKALLPNALFDSRDERVVEIVSPRVVRNSSCQLGPDKEPSSHVENIERIDANPDKASIHALISPKSVSLRSEKRRKRYERSIETSKEHVTIGKECVIN